jgi:hypothetical protein
MIGTTAPAHVTLAHVTLAPTRQGKATRHLTARPATARSRTGFVSTFVGLLATLALAFTLIALAQVPAGISQGARPFPGGAGGADAVPQPSAGFVVDARP